MRRTVLVISLIACALAACAPPAALNTPAATATLTATAQAPSPSPTSTVSSTPAAAPTLAPPSRGVRILWPGSGSAVASPIPLHALLQPGAERVDIELVGQSGALLYRRVLNAPGVELRQSINFNVRTEGPARLTLLVFDALGRTSFASSLALELLTDGASHAAEPGAAGEILIEAPVMGSELAPGQVVVSGRMRGQSGRPLVVQLLSDAGRVLYSQEVYPGDPGADGMRPFRLDLQISVSEDSLVLLTVSQGGGAVPGLWMLNSVEVILLAE